MQASDLIPAVTRGHGMSAARQPAGSWAPAAELPRRNSSIPAAHQLGVTWTSSGAAPKLPGAKPLTSHTSLAALLAVLDTADTDHAPPGTSRRGGRPFAAAGRLAPEAQQQQKLDAFVHNGSPLVRSPTELEMDAILRGDSLSADLDHRASDQQPADMHTGTGSDQASSPADANTGHAASANSWQKSPQMRIPGSLPDPNSSRPADGHAPARRRLVGAKLDSRDVSSVGSAPDPLSARSKGLTKRDDLPGVTRSSEASHGEGAAASAFANPNEENEPGGDTASSNGESASDAGISDPDSDSSTDYIEHTLGGDTGMASKSAPYRSQKRASQQSLHPSVLLSQVSLRQRHSSSRRPSDDTALAAASAQGFATASSQQQFSYQQSLLSARSSSLASGDDDHALGSVPRREASPGTSNTNKSPGLRGAIPSAAHLSNEAADGKAGLDHRGEAGHGDLVSVPASASEAKLLGHIPADTSTGRHDEAAGNRPAHGRLLSPQQSLQGAALAETAHPKESPSASTATAPGRDKNETRADAVEAEMDLLGESVLPGSPGIPQEVSSSEAAASSDGLEAGCKIQQAAPSGSVQPMMGQGELLTDESAKGDTDLQSTGASDGSQLFSPHSKAPTCGDGNLHAEDAGERQQDQEAQSSNQHAGWGPADASHSSHAEHPGKTFDSPAMSAAQSHQQKMLDNGAEAGPAEPTMSSMPGSPLAPAGETSLPPRDEPKSVSAEAAGSDGSDMVAEVSEAGQPRANANPPASPSRLRIQTGADDAGGWADPASPPSPFGQDGGLAKPRDLGRAESAEPALMLSRPSDAGSEVQNGSAASSSRVSADPVLDAPPPGAQPPPMAAFLPARTAQDSNQQQAVAKPGTVASHPIGESRQLLNLLLLIRSILF